MSDQTMRCPHCGGEIPIEAFDKRVADLLREVKEQAKRLFDERDQNAISLREMKEQIKSLDKLAQQSDRGVLNTAQMLIKSLENRLLEAEEKMKNK